MKYTKELFVAKATAIFDNLYDYTKFEFIDMKTKGLVTCNKCSNEWLVAPSVHISYQTHCPMCSKKNKQISLQEFKAKAMELYKDKFDYSLVDELPNGASSKISIRCIKHNLIFKQSIRTHLEGRTACKDCLSIKTSKTNEDCIIELKDIPNYEKINFTKFEYKGDRNKITITCNDCNTDKTILYTTLKSNGFHCRCNWSRINNSFHKQNYIKAHKNCILYLIQLSNEKELFYKIGITYNSVDIRFKSLKGYTITTLYELKKESKLILDLEEHVKGCIINNDKYLPQIYFDGHRETFSIESLPKVLKFLHSIES